MDSFFGIGAPELVFILLLAGIIMGPQRIRAVAHWLGKTTAQLQVIARGFSRQLNAELDAVDGSGDIRDTMKEMQELRRQIADLRREVISVAAQPMDETRKIVEESKTAVENTIRPPKLGSGSEAPKNDADSASQSLPNLVDVVDDPD